MKKFTSYLILISLLLTGCKKKTPTADANINKGSETLTANVIETNTPEDDEGAGSKSNPENCIFDFSLVEIEDISYMENGSLSIILSNVPVSCLVRVDGKEFDCVEDGEYEDRLHCVGPEPAPGEEVTLELSNEDNETQWEVIVIVPTPTEDEEGNAEGGGATPSPSETPGDQDGDGILDSEDACKSEAGPAENDGCPWPDSDDDGINDNEDACPYEYGPVENNGCPVT